MIEEGPVAYEEPGPVSPRAQPKVATTIYTPVEKVPGPSPEPPAFLARLAALDRYYSKWVHENCLTDFTYACLRFFEFSGDGFFWLPVAVAFWLSPSAGSPATRAFALNLLVCLLFDLVVVGSIKSVVRRRRPHYNRGHFVVVSVDSWSFPSGHSTRAVMIVTLIWLYHPLWQTMKRSSPFVAEEHLLMVVYGLLVLWMVATACSRVVLGRHYISDVLGGMAIGVAEALVAHFLLHVPLKFSEVQHAYFVARMGAYEEVFWRFFPGEWISVKHAEQGIL